MKFAFLCFYNSVGHESVQDFFLTFWICFSSDLEYIKMLSIQGVTTLPSMSPRTPFINTWNKEGALTRPYKSEGTMGNGYRYSTVVLLTTIVSSVSKVCEQEEHMKTDIWSKNLGF